MSVITLSTQDNAKLFQQLKPGFKRTVKWKKYQSDPKTYLKKRYLNHLVDPSFQGVTDFLYYLVKTKMIEYHIQTVIFQKYK